jgi:hypothetical protein
MKVLKLSVFFSLYILYDVHIVRCFRAINCWCRCFLINRHAHSLSSFSLVFNGLSSFAFSSRKDIIHHDSVFHYKVIRFLSLPFDCGISLNVFYHKFINTFSVQGFPFRALVFVDFARSTFIQISPAFAGFHFRTDKCSRLVLLRFLFMQFFLLFPFNRTRNAKLLPSLTRFGLSCQFRFVSRSIQ